MTAALGYSAIVSPAAELATGIAVKSTLVIALASLLAFVFRRSSAAYRSAIWSTALGSLILLPLLSLVIPSWEIAQVEMTAPDKPNVEAAGPAAPASSRNSPSPTVGGVTNAGEPAGAGTEVIGGAGRQSYFSFGAKYLSVIFIAIWLSGLAFLLSRLTVHAGRVRKICREASDNDDADVSDVIAEAISNLGIHRPVRVAWSEDTSMPFSCGLWKPTVILPTSGRLWPRDRKRAVLLHELAHVVRWDYMWHLLIQLACALHWPNPAVWHAERRNALERERACDDYALRFGTPSDVYASELLQIARLQVRELNPAPAVTMAGRADLTGRVRSIMAKRISRSPIPVGGLVVIACVAVLLTLPLSALGVFGTRSYEKDPMDVPSTKELIRDLRDAGDPIVRRQAAWWLGEHEDERAVQPLIEDGLSDRSADVRLVSAWALGEIKDDAAIYPLISTLEHDGDPLVREMAALALGEIENPLAVDALLEALEREEGLTGPVIWALGEIGNERAERARSAAIANSGWRRGRNNEVWAGELRSRISAPYGKKFDKPDCREGLTASLSSLASADPDDRVEAAFNIGALGISRCRETAVAVKPLLETLRDPRPEVRAMAVWALDEINPSRWGRSWQKREYRK